jgi:hypothetical protein
VQDSFLLHVNYSFLLSAACNSVSYLIIFILYIAGTFPM